MLAWNGPTPSGLMILHGEKGGLDNSVANLSFGTGSKNQGEDRRRDGTLPCGEKHGRAKLTEEQVREIRSRSGNSITALAKEYGVSQRSIYGIINGITWKCVQATPGIDRLRVLS